jgi:hypothetical protein
MNIFHVSRLVKDFSQHSVPTLASAKKRLGIPNNTQISSAAAKQ